MYNDDYLIHYGIKGMKWGVRRYQNKDGTLTDAGKKRVNKYNTKLQKMSDLYNKERAKSDELYKQYNVAINKKHKTFKEYLDPKYDSGAILREIGIVDDWSRYYRDKSKRLINKVSKIDEKLGAKLTRKYSKMLDKIYLGDFTLSELKQLSKDSGDLSDKGKKYLDQERNAALMRQKVKTEISSRNAESMQRHMQMQQQMLMDQQLQMQIQMQIDQQIQMQIQQQIDMQNMQMMGMM